MADEKQQPDECPGATGADRGQARQRDAAHYRYAFVNPYNLSLLAGAGVAAAATGQWWLGSWRRLARRCGMLFAPTQRSCGAPSGDRIWESEQVAEHKKRQAQKFAVPPDKRKVRALSLRDLQIKIQKLAQDNPAFRWELLSATLGKLDEVVDDFLSWRRCAPATIATF